MQDATLGKPGGRSSSHRGPFKGKVVHCVEKAFKHVKVSPFRGDPMHVGKLFKIE